MTEKMKYRKDEWSKKSETFHLRSETVKSLVSRQQTEKKTWMIERYVQASCQRQPLTFEAKQNVESCHNVNRPWTKASTLSSRKSFSVHGMSQIVDVFCHEESGLCWFGTCDESCQEYGQQSGNCKCKVAIEEITVHICKLAVEKSRQNVFVHRHTDTFSDLLLSQEIGKSKCWRGEKPGGFVTQWRRNFGAFFWSKRGSKKFAIHEQGPQSE